MYYIRINEEFYIILYINIILNNNTQKMIVKILNNNFLVSVNHEIRTLFLSKNKNLKFFLM